MALTKVTYSMIQGAVVNVLDYIPASLYASIANGTNTTDLRSNINAAFTALFAQGGGTLYLPKGTYFVSDFIGNTDYAGVTQAINIAVEGEVGTIIDCDPSVFANSALFLRFQNLNVGIVRNLVVNCNDKVSTGIFVTSAGQAQSIIVDNCQVDNPFGIDNVGATTNVSGISTSSALGYACSITNCRVFNVRRAKQTLACQAIVATGFITTWIENNTVFNVRHDGTALQDADGIVVFSHNDGTGRYYRQSAATIINNRIADCEGRFIKLQTHGSALVEGNTMTIVNNIQLIVNFQFIDSQVGEATIINNKFESLATAWTGGASSTLCSLQTPELANLAQSYEVFTQKFSNNEAYLRKEFTYGITATPFKANVAATSVFEVCDNVILADQDINSVTPTANAVARFWYFSTITPVADVTGRSIWKVSGNKVQASEFISVGPSRADYTGKWFMYIHDNIKYGAFNFLIRNAGSSPYDFPYTSNAMIRDNQMGTAPQQVTDLFGAPINSALLINGSDFSTGDGSAGTISPAPANWNNGHFGRKGGVLFAETVASATAYRYISRDNGANWYQV